MVRSITSDEHFKSVISGPAVVAAEFRNPKDASSRKMSSEFMLLEDSYPDAGVYKVDIRQLSDIAPDMDLPGIPSFIVFRDGEEIEFFLGEDTNIGGLSVSHLSVLGNGLSAETALSQTLLDRVSSSGETDTSLKENPQKR
ncbi:hypothetical protein L198_07314 [Cryptococcus wingfieldii CBS 7118]|uniref:Thioredoxin domain-containing protein n=1 Tax=Cryptococcus wingfieldii CBS 7118 TaxID=1295528 RepID=A0A1E3ICH0_9TREE|nr:hypothetical protein L198_07314 [Cryptococcus wingfieldii CBS 7118]ODN86297.1 hypothetical protein L198_07314 [Cryptococcus wingfieldii CBS 7118]